MLAPVTFQKTNGKRIAIDTYDICRVDETQDLVVVTYVIVPDTPEMFDTPERLEDVLDKIKRAQEDAMPKGPRDEGDDWKGT